MTRKKWVWAALAAGAGLVLFLRSGTLLLWAAGHDYTSLASVSLRLRENPNARDGHGRTALMVTADRGNALLAQDLLRRGARVDAEDEEGNEVMYYARCWRDPGKQIARILLERGADANSKNHQGRTPLMQAAWYHDLIATRDLLQGGARIDAADEKGRQALHYAAGSHDESGEVVRLLLRSGADPNARTKDGDVPLILSISEMSGATEANALQLIAVTQDINYRDSVTRETALAIAASEASSKVMESLLKAGANPNIPEVHGRLPIQIVGDDPFRVKLLLEYGADPFLNCGESPSAYDAMKENHLRPDLLAMMEDARPALSKRPPRNCGKT